MNIRYLFAVLFTGLSFQTAFAQDNTHDSYKWWNPATSNFPVIEGQAWPGEGARPYDRLPARAEQTVRKAVWQLSGESAGLMIRFRSDAPDIRVRYTVSGGLNMPHMSSTGVSGVDLYAVDKNGKWEWSAGKYSFNDTIEYHFHSLQHTYVEEYRLYLPLYNQVKWLEIGVPEGSRMVPLPVRPDKPIVVYGTSIAQGACASRPGMAWTAILGRRLDRPVINLGFSGNGQLEGPVADLLTETDPAVFVLDCFPNLSGFPADTVKRRLIATVTTLQRRYPETPVLIVEDADAAIGSLDASRDSVLDRVNAAAREAFAELKAAGIQHIYFLTAAKIGLDIESTVDGTHPSDAGMERYASAYAKAIRDILHEPAGQYATMQPCIQSRDRSYDWEARHRALLKMNKEDPPAIIFLGNSITQRWGGGPGKATWEKYFAPAGVRNSGFGADRIENVLWRVYHGELDGYKAKQVILLIGTNNFGPSTDAEILAGLKLLVQAIKERQPSAKILLLGIFPRREQEQRVAALNEQIVQLCGNENIDYADPGTLLLDASGKIKGSFFSDAVHPTAEAYQVLSQALAPYLASGGK